MHKFLITVGLVLREGRLMERSWFARERKKEEARLLRAAKLSTEVSTAAASDTNAFSTVC